ncbi:MAG: mechanosensitive ion channel [Phenylobacterium sp.]|uniref:mechanosensitive ion channel family protein n=1 Tax=Phenylobacterium sp. TaxID=1871053 RepID=UPI0017F7AA65|nr:mechanosensitive ion channel family protein [Phenylobacterium sp.]MBA4792224.1 mechanosensitive ion channel [Phenylobacterium sp.]
MLRWLLPALALFLAGPAGGQVPEAPTDPAPVIASRTAAGEDRDIAARIEAIFAQVDGLQGAEVRVSSGVVTLTGSVATPREAEQAEAIARRVAGVVTVQNALERDLDVRTNVAPAVERFEGEMRGLIQGLPLLGVAIGVAALIGFAGHLLAGVGRLWTWLTPNAFMAELAASSARVVFIVLGVVIGLDILGATALLGAVLGGAGVIGIALGFAVRDTVDNYVSSLMLSLRQPFRANDHVVIEGQEGRVIRLTSRATVLMTLDGNHLRIPNAIVFKAVILNYTRNPQRRFQFDLGVDAKDDPLQAMAVGLATINDQPFVLADPEASAVIQEVGDSNIVLRFFGWIDQRETDFLKGRSLCIQAVKAALEDGGFSLPEPIYRLRFDPGAAPSGLPPQPTAPSAPARRPSAAETREARDTAPAPAVEELVRQERAGTQRGDLLDDRRPIE